MWRLICLMHGIFELTTVTSAYLCKKKKEKNQQEKILSKCMLSVRALLLLASFFCLQKQYWILTHMWLLRCPTCFRTEHLETAKSGLVGLHFKQQNWVFTTYCIKPACLRRSNLPRLLYCVLQTAIGELCTVSFSLGRKLLNPAEDHMAENCPWLQLMDTYLQTDGRWPQLE